MAPCSSATTLNGRRMTTPEWIWDRTPSSAPPVHEANQLGDGGSPARLRAVGRANGSAISPWPTLVICGCADWFPQVGNAEALAAQDAWRYGCFKSATLDRSVTMVWAISLRRRLLRRA